MKKFICLLFLSARLAGQDTFSILAFDSLTREIGAAGASCLNLNATPFSNNDFICEIFPDTGAIACQAAYIPANQNNARIRMRANDSPQQILTWLNNNDVVGSPAWTTRQYGVVRMDENIPCAAFSGTACIDFKGHRVGPNYTIHGNILLGPEVLDSMEARFLRADGDLACKLMAAMQGAKMIGADTRCSQYGTSSLFAFLKVAQPADTFGKPSFIVSVRTTQADGVEPIDSLQRLFDATGHLCQPPNPAGIRKQVAASVSVFPNPSKRELNFITSSPEPVRLEVFDALGRKVFSGKFFSSLNVDVSGWEKGIYICDWYLAGGRRQQRKVVVE